MTQLASRCWMVLLFLVPLGSVVLRGASAQSVPDGAERLEGVELEDAELFRLDHRLFIIPAEMSIQGSVTIPRFCGSLRSVSGLNSGDELAVSIHPEPSQWIVRWHAAAEADGIVLAFDQPPRLPSELEPASPAGDGSVMLPAYRAITSGEKLRYEPQPFKNTVGYWTVPTDSAAWRLKLDRGGKFNVGILQGCGEGQGGSRGTIELIRSDQVHARLEFEVKETGHFQNFQWRYLGEINVPKPADYSLKIVPTEIKKAALMDVRAVHLIPVPE